MTGVNLLRQTNCRICTCCLLNALLKGWPHYDSINGHRVMLFELVRTALLEATPPLIHMGWLIQHQLWNPVKHCTADKGLKSSSWYRNLELPDAVQWCSRTLVACWTTRRVKGFPFNPLAFTHVSLDTENSKLCEDSIFGNSVWHCVCKIGGLFRWRN